MPMLYPTAFCSRRLRKLSANTQNGYLQTIKRIAEWEAEEGLDIAKQLMGATGFNEQQLSSLEQALSTKKDKHDSESINSISFNISLSHSSEYLTWLFKQLRSNPNSPEDVTFTEELSRMLTARKRPTGSKAAYAQDLVDKKLAESTRQALTERFDNPYGLKETPFEKGIAFRDNLMLRILYDLGLRIGELLSLTNESFIHASGGDHAYLIIARNQDDEYDRRVNQPVVKTNGRQLAIDPSLEADILEYLGTWRADVPSAGFEGGSYLFIVHKASPNQGQELATSTIRSALKTIIKSDKRLTGLHPHLLRHDWNYRFSQECKSLGKTEDQEMMERCILMGWKIGSDMAKHYNRRHIAEESWKVGVAIAHKASRPRN